ncbi:hypothetical protein BN1708_015422 [Verticillium longisporum]|uniref:Uncharacterized protein n=1 Tax=Verticillium longisporum TaxID=100787 RepID=A0A0G4M4T9_VERLO|nr:hypothetical protein BN1708_015422 [Verticillium longisporum]
MHPGKIRRGHWLLPERSIYPVLPVFLASWSARDLRYHHFDCSFAFSLYSLQLGLGDFCVLLAHREDGTPRYRFENAQLTQQLSLRRLSKPST